MRSRGDEAGQTPEKVSTGRAGEEAAARHLTRHGCVILARNWRAAPGEIDIVARCPLSGGHLTDAGSGLLYDPARDMLAFVEVRTRHGEAGMAEESVSARKIASMTSAAMQYLEASNLDPEETPWRIDLVAVRMSGERVLDVNWLQGVGQE